MQSKAEFALEQAVKGLPENSRAEVTVNRATVFLKFLNENPDPTPEPIAPVIALNLSKAKLAEALKTAIEKIDSEQQARDADPH